MTDNKVWKTFLAGDKNAISEIFLEYYDDLFRYGFKLSSDSGLVEDSIQELFLKLWVPTQPEGEIIDECWDIITSADNFDATFISTKNLLFPIPQGETSANPNVTQNEGY